MIERIEIHVTALSTRLKRIFASGTYDTGPDESITRKRVRGTVHADGVVGYGQIRPISPGHFVADTTQSMVAAIREFYGPAMIGRSLFDSESINEMFDNRLAGNPAARAVLDIALRDAHVPARAHLRGLVVVVSGGTVGEHVPRETESEGGGRGSTPQLTQQ